MAQAPGEFAIVRNAVLITPRNGDFGGKTIRATFPAPRRASEPAARAPARGITALDVMSGTAKAVRTDAVTLDPPLLTALMTSGAREKRRRVSLETIPKRMQLAVLAIEDQSYYSHPGVNPFSVIRAVIINAVGGNKYPSGAARLPSSSHGCSSSPTSSAASSPPARVPIAARCRRRSCRSCSSGAHRRTRSSSSI
jgi:hypothetical protein